VPRLYYLADDLHACERIGQALKDAGIRDWNFHVLSKDEIGLYQHRIHAATTYQQLDVIHTGQRRGLGGAGVGVLIGALAYAVQPLPWEVDGFAVALIALAGGLFGAWQGAVAGLSRENYKIAPFHDDLEAGRHLLMVDVSDKNRARVREIMNVRFPSAEFRGRDTTLIGPFANHHTPAPGSTGR
jgi:hypothetical protein